jgi:hypothetical protein
MGAALGREEIENPLTGAARGKTASGGGGQDPETAGPTLRLRISPG